MADPGLRPRNLLGGQLVLHLYSASGPADGLLLQVRVYDEATKRLSQVLEGGDSVNTPGHSNRIFSLKSAGTRCLGV